MAAIPVRFTYITGIRTDKFTNPRLRGSWDRQGLYSENWTEIPMAKEWHTDGCACFRATVELHDSQEGRTFRWGVCLDGPGAPGTWGITGGPALGKPQERSFILGRPQADAVQSEEYYLTHCGRLGAVRHFSGTDSAEAAIQFTVWAPNAEKVEVVFGDPKTGYIADDGYGIDPSMPVLAMTKGTGGIWATDPASAALSRFSEFDHKPYMYRIFKKGDTGLKRPAFRTDLYSRCQIGAGKLDPKRCAGSCGHYHGSYADLDGTLTCSVVIDPTTVARDFETAGSMAPPVFIGEAEFWEGDGALRARLPKRVEDLVIYELHVGALGYGKTDSQGNPVPGDVKDAMEFLDHIAELGVNCVEFLPMSQFEGFSWGYGTSHHFAVEYAAGGRDQYKHIVRECHRKGLAVIQDVVYNHYDADAERSEWAYDSDLPEENIYYWYEGRSGDYPSPDGGYVDNMSTGFAPRFSEEMVRKMFISSAVALTEEFHVDGFRVDQTTSIHSYNRLHKDGREVGGANTAGGAFLRELNATLKLVNPSVIMIAEDHSDWDKVTTPLDDEGIGFDAAWYAEFFHNLMGSSGVRLQNARLIKLAGYGDNNPLAMDKFAGSLEWAAQRKVVYHESHDEAGNSENSARTIVVASNFAPLVGDTRRYAEARSKVAFGLSLLSPGTPMFLFGEEVGAWQPYKYNDFMYHKDDILGLKKGYGRGLFTFYKDLIRFVGHHGAFRARKIEILHMHNNNRVIAFRRTEGNEDFFVAASLNNFPFTDGYRFSGLPGGEVQWREVFNSDSAAYGGNNVGNSGGVISSRDGTLDVVVPANGFVVFQKI